MRRASADLDVSDWTVRGRTRKAQVSSSPPKKRLAVEEENRRLREENRQLKLEREILKKATAFFARHEK